MGKSIDRFILQQGLAKEFTLGQLGTQLCSRRIMALCVGAGGGVLILVGQLEKKKVSRTQLTG